MTDLTRPFVDESRLGVSGRAVAACRAENRAALVGYLPVGYPDVPGSIAAMVALTQGTSGRGVDAVEIGMPYSDPMMDGPAIQHADTRAIARGVRTRDVFSAVEAVAATGTTPLVMIYYNLVEHYGARGRRTDPAGSVRAFARDLVNAGGAGLITPDLTPDDATFWTLASDEFGLDRVYLVAPSSTDERIAETAAACRGWVYSTSVMGVTGARSQISDAAPRLVERVRRLAPDLPVGVGLGISNGAQAGRIGAFADLAIVGSALVKRLIVAEDAGGASLDGLRVLVDDLAAGVRTAR
ncbi:tryptophan synthase subunit alpha [uncultured Propionibacterium sp.]|uniref:tryptophan synthase subunit alpha n=1 Tax=uncultured Propionibacterium sp. TaxID=218066 RepID=UPI00292FB8F0|nr:tryptophan synthase subunit alpha [uncultured Propionibacterium sp.]